MDFHFTFGMHSSWIHLQDNSSAHLTNTDTRKTNMSISETLATREFQINNNNKKKNKNKTKKKEI